MLFWKTVDIADNERALMYRRNRFEKVLEPGRHRFMDAYNEIEINLYDITSAAFDAPRARFLVNEYSDALEKYLDVFELSDTQVGILYRNGKFEEILSPGSFRAVWKGEDQFSIDTIDIVNRYEIDSKLIGILGRGIKIGQSRTAMQAIAYVEVPDEQVGLLMVNGKFEKILEPGAHGLWKFNRSIVIKILDLRLQSSDVSGQEILTKDRVSLRINLVADLQVG